LAGVAYTDLTLNFAPVSCSDKRIRVGVLDYRGKPHLQELRDQHDLSYVLRREGDKIITVPVVAGLRPLGNEVEERLLSTDSDLLLALIQHSLFRYFLSHKRLIRRVRPLRVLAEPAKDLLHKAASPARLPEWLSFRTQHELTTRSVHGDSPEVRNGILFDFFLKVGIRAPCAELLRLGVPIVGRYVGKLTSRGPHLTPRLDTLGRVANVQGELLELDDCHDEDSSTVSAADCYLEPRREALEACVRALLPRDHAGVLKRLARIQAGLQSGPGRLQKIEAIRAHLAGAQLEILPGLKIDLGRFTTRAQLQPKRAPSVLYTFDHARERTHRSADKGLDRHGPLTRQSFTPRRPRVCVICQSRRRGDVELFLRRLLDGIPGRSTQPGVFDNGFLRKYHVEGLDLEFFETKTPAAGDYRSAALQAIESRSGEWDFAFVQTDEAFHKLYGERNPYLVTKATFFQHGIPVQEFEYETTQMPERNLRYTLNNISLATYSKLGGIPWLLPVSSTITHELVIGVSTALVGKGRFGDRQRYLGITTVFTGDGNYWLANTSNCVPYSEFQAELVHTLETAIRRVKAQLNWRPGDAIRIVFHCFKPLKYTEADAVDQVVKGLNDYDLDYAFLHVAGRHDCVLFDPNQSGSGRGSSVKGIFAPERRTYTHLSLLETLLVLTGPKDVKLPTQGLPRPIKLKLHPRSTFRDMDYLTKQVALFAGHSWRDFFPASMPVTISYSNQIARLLGNLSTLPGFDPSVLRGKLATKGWFL